ncbi:cell surface glycoprotein CD200 receptor 1 isoform X2 [Nelusetta ayraudi]|uniref:cell surface glycoprotein CD200 receptor 1 isoform X2 n=1 Tax=Nelusetta ayraudi TaxID=303726 RepID=UPI003F72079C
MLWIYATFLLLSQAWGRETVVRNQTFHLGSDVMLECNNVTWNDIVYILWNLDLGHKKCVIGFSRSGQSSEGCHDGKMVRNTSSAQLYLHIPKFSKDDVGVYKCESAYKGGRENYLYNVGIKGRPPSSNAWLERRNGMLVAVCNVSSVKPAANISWNHEGVLVNTQEESDGMFIAESRLELLKETDAETLKCTIRHPDWPEEWILQPKFRESDNPLMVIMCGAGIVIFLAGAAFFVMKKQTLRPCRQSSTSPSQCTPKEDAEEVEPYASYVQRVNSIYNSSADLFA